VYESRDAQNSGSGLAPLRVAVADDDVLLREGLASWLTRRHFDVVGQASDAHELLALVHEKEPGLVIIDIRMPPTQTTEGLDAARRIRDELPDTAILLLSAYAASFLDSLERIANGASVLDPTLMAEVINARRRAQRLAALSTRENQVLALMAEGRSNTGIAARLGVSGPTVATHVHGIFVKLQLPDDFEDHRRVRAVSMYLEEVAYQRLAAK
jgi:DNA-binding NarL/FixJ family response regulator